MTDDLEHRMHEAFDQVHMPQGLAERTLKRIEQVRTEQEGTTPTTSSLKVVSPDAARRPARRRPARLRVALALAACLALAAVGIGGVAWASVPYAYVAIDVNPSIELGINRFDRVASTKAYNEDGEQVLEAAQVSGMIYEDAMDAIDDALADYLDADATVEITIVCDNEESARQLETVGAHCLDADGTGQVRCSHATEQEHHEADAANMGIGKYRVFTQLVEAGVDITAEEASNMTMSELLDLAQSSGVTISSHAAGSHDSEEAAEHDAETGHHGEGASDSAATASQDSTGSGAAGQRGEHEGAEANHRNGRHHDE